MSLMKNGAVTIITVTFCTLVFLTIASYLSTPIVSTQNAVVPAHDSKLIGGDLVNLRQFPYYVSFRLTKVRIQHYCSGTILNRNWIITSAICLGDSTDTYEDVVLAVGTIKMIDPGDEYFIERVILHPNFTSLHEYYDYNIALVKTTRPIRFTRRVKPVTLNRDFINEDQQAVVVGWTNVSE